jgi:hypothetical protein
MNMKTRALLVLNVVLVIAAGCSDENATTSPSASASNSTSASSMPGIEAATYRLADEPAGAQDVIAVRESAVDDEEVVIVGRIGGDSNPWVEGRAAFSIVDRSLLACSDREGDECPQPWDYCCETDKLPTSKVLVKVVDESGNVVKADARDLLHLKELQTVVIRGTARRIDEGNLVVLARGVYVNSSDGP